MDAEEIKDRLKSVITSLIKDDPETARAEMHDVLAAKMRDRVNPEPEVDPTSIDPEDDTTDPEDPPTD